MQLYNPRTATVALAVVAVALVSACGGGEPEQRDVTVRLDGATLAPDTVKVKKGDTLTLTIESDRPGEVHVHVYDNRVDVSPDEPGVLTIMADLEGRFPIAFHALDGEEEEGHAEHEEEDGAAETEEINVGILEVGPR